MFDKLKGAVDGIKERAGEIADENSAASLQKRNEQRMVEAAEREAAKEITKDRLNSATASKVLGLGAKVLRGAVAASTTAKNVSEALSADPPKFAQAEEHPDNGERVKPITEKIPEWM